MAMLQRSVLFARIRERARLSERNSVDPRSFGNKNFHFKELPFLKKKSTAGVWRNTKYPVRMMKAGVASNNDKPTIRKRKSHHYVTRSGAPPSKQHEDFREDRTQLGSHPQ